MCASGPTEVTSNFDLATESYAELADAGVFSVPIVQNVRIAGHMLFWSGLSTNLRHVCRVHEMSARLR